MSETSAHSVGSGPSPTELDNALGERLRAVGHEFGATTGRARRCGWFDAAMVRHAAMVNGLTAIALTKLDVLSGMGPLRIAVGYAGMDDVPAGAAELARAEPLYEEIAGWDEDLSACRTWESLPAACRAYVERVEELTGVPVVLLGVGPGRDALIERGAWNV